MNDFLFISLVSSVLIVALCSVRKLAGPRVGPRWFYWIWLLLTVRLLVPVDVTYEWGVKLSLPAMMVDIRAEEPGFVVSSTMTERLPSGEVSASTTEIFVSPQTNILPTDNSFFWNEIFSLNGLIGLWLVGMFTTWFYYVGVYHRFKKQLFSNATPLTEPEFKKLVKSIAQRLQFTYEPDLYKSNQVSSPMLIGFWQPKLILPVHFTAENHSLKYVLAHELVHIKRKDLLYKALLMLVQGVHWFNPAVYLLAKTAAEDIEMSCDEKAIRSFSEEHRQAYMQALLTYAQAGLTGRMAGVETFSGSKHMLKRRLEQIIHMHKKRRGSNFIGVLLIVFLIFGSLIGCERTDSSDGEKTTSQVAFEVESLYKYKTKFVGNNSDVGNIINRLEYPVNIRNTGFSLHTKEEPYGISIALEANSEQQAALASIQAEQQLRDVSAVIFALIDNLSYIEYNVRKETEGESIMFKIERVQIDQWLESELKIDTAEAGSSIDEFAKLYAYAFSAADQPEKEQPVPGDFPIGKELITKLEQEEKQEEKNEVRKESDEFLLVDIELVDIFTENKEVIVLAVVRKMGYSFSDGVFENTYGHLSAVEFRYIKAGNEYVRTKKIYPHDGTLHSDSLKKMARGNKKRYDKMLHTEMTSEVYGRNMFRLEQEAAEKGLVNYKHRLDSVPGYPKEQSVILPCQRQHLQGNSWVILKDDYEKGRQAVGVENWPHCPAVVYHEATGLVVKGLSYDEFKSDK